MGKTYRLRYDKDSDGGDYKGHKYQRDDRDEDEDAELEDAELEAMREWRERDDD